MSTIIFILVLSFLVIIHELGHFIAAKWSKVKVDEFGIGYPPKAIKLFTWRGTDFTINWIPFGGFVRMQGEDVVIEPTGQQSHKSSKKQVAVQKSLEIKSSGKKSGQFYQATVIQKLMIILSGASINFIFGVLAFAIVFSKMGIPQYINEARIGEISEGSPAQEAGINSGVNIVGFQMENAERVNISNVDALIEEISQHKGKTVKIFTTGQCEVLECDKTENEYTVYLRLLEETPQDQGSLGIVFDQVVYVFYPGWQMPFKSIAYGLQQALFLGVQVIQAFFGVIFGLFTQAKISGDVAGPIGIIHQAQTFGIFEQGFSTVLSFAGMLSINLAVMNVLPFPPLDGGRALFVVLELIFKKKRTKKIEYYLNYGGYIFLLTLVGFITFKDVLRIFGK
ncbi:MAG: site-2 protease family protein [Pseudomonadales bacterium]|nr:site-2 protease family protein [Pseudomonadales bacterium]